MVARFGPKTGRKGSAKTEVQALWRGDDHKKNTLKIENMICSTLRAQVGKTAWEAWVLETPLEDIKTEVERVALMVKSSQS